MSVQSIFSLSFHKRRDGVSHTLHAGEECFRTAKLEEHVETDRHVVLVVGDVEAHYLLPFPVLILQLRELHAAVFLAVVCLHLCSAVETQTSRCGALAVGNREVYDMTLLPICRTEGACPHEDVHHVEHTVAGSEVLP